MVAKVLFLTLAVIIIGALSLMALIKVWDVAHESMAKRKVRKLNQKLDEIEGN